MIERTGTVRIGPGMCNCGKELPRHAEQPILVHGFTFGDVTFDEGYIEALEWARAALLAEIEARKA